MPTWKKVIVSGSNANLSALQVDNLTSGNVVIGGGTGNLTTTAINGTGSIVATTNATNLVHSGSFSGSFRGDGSALTGVTGVSFPTTGVGTLLSTTNVFVNNGSNVSASVAQFNSSSWAGVSGDITINGNTGVATLKANIISGSQLSTTAPQGTVVNVVNGVSQSAALLNLGTGGSPTFANLTVSGDLSVNGTTTFINTTNTLIKDQFLLLNSGSAPTGDGGIIIQNTATFTGSAFYFSSGSITGNTGVGRWAVSPAVASSATTATVNSYIVAVSSSTTLPTGDPIYGGSANGHGNMYIKTDTGDIYIYA